MAPELHGVRHREEPSPSYSWYIRDWRASFRVQHLSWKERGFYRECLDWAWDLDGLPDDLELIRSRVGATRGDFLKLWPAAKQFFDVGVDGRLRNARQELERRKQNANRRRASDGGAAKAEAVRQLLAATNLPIKTAPSVAVSSASSSAASREPKQTSPPVASSASHYAPLSPSPSPVPSPSPSPLQPRRSLTARSRHPCFTGQRLTVFEWMYDDLVKMLGLHTEAFGLDEWFYTADAKALTLPDVRKREDWWPWLLGETLEEARRRGLPVSAVTWAHTGRATSESLESQVEGVRAILKKQGAIT